MSTRTPMSALLLAALLAGCAGDDKTCDSGDTGCDTGSEEVEPYDGPTTVDRVSWDCDDSRYWYDVYTVGWTGGAELTIVDPGEDGTASWTETHDLGHWAIDEDGYWEELYLELTILQEPECSRELDAEDACWKIQEPGVSTLPLCDADTKARLSLAVVVFEEDDPSAQADCVAWGADPDQFVGCTAFDVE